MKPQYHRQAAADAAFYSATVQAQDVPGGAAQRGNVLSLGAVLRLLPSNEPAKLPQTPKVPEVKPHAKPDCATARDHLCAASIARKWGEDPWSHARKAITVLEGMGVREGWHLAFENTGISESAWKAATGETYEATRARHHFAAVKEQKAHGLSVNTRVVGLIGRKFASAAGVTCEKGLESQLKIKPDDWKAAFGEPFAPLDGEWTTIAHNANGTALRSFNLKQRIKVAPNSYLG